MLSVQGGFSSIYVYGDSVSTTTSNTFGGVYYHGNRECNGRVWIEVLAQRQGMAYQESNNLSYYGHYTTNMLAEVSSFSAPPDASNSLFIIWVINADLVDDIALFPMDNSGLAQWTNALNVSLTNHQMTITNLYGKGFRSFMLPTAVDVMAIPLYSGADPTLKSFVRQRVIEFNTKLGNLMTTLKDSLPGTVFYSPDFFALLDNFQSNAPLYGLTNALTLSDYGLHTADAIFYCPGAATNGPGTNWIFWDYQSPSAKAHVVMADVANQLLSPTAIRQVTRLTGSNRLDVVNMPLGLPGYVYGGTNLTNFAGWTSLTNFSSLTATQAVFVPPATDDLQFYRLTFTNSWSWP